MFWQLLFIPRYSYWTGGLKKSNHQETSLKLNQIFWGVLNFNLTCVATRKAFTLFASWRIFQASFCTWASCAIALAATPYYLEQFFRSWSFVSFDWVQLSNGSQLPSRWIYCSKKKFWTFFLFLSNLLEYYFSFFQSVGM